MIRTVITKGYGNQSSNNSSILSHNMKKKHKREVAEDLTRVSLRVTAFVYRFPAWHLLGMGRGNLTTTFAAMMDEQFYLLTIFFTPNRRNRTPFKVFKVCDDVFSCTMSEGGTGGDSNAVSIFVWHWLSRQIVLDNKIQITILIYQYTETRCLV